MLKHLLPLVALLFSSVPAASQTLPVTELTKATLHTATGLRTPPPDREPEYRAGQQLLCLSGELMGSDKPLPSGDYCLQIFTLTGWHYGEIGVDAPLEGQTLLTFEKSAEFGTARYSVAYEREITALPGLFPVLDDANVRYLQKKYEGKTVYPYGSVSLTGIARDMQYGEITLQYGYDTPLRIRRIVRVRRKEAVSTEISESEKQIITHDPLVVIVEPARTAEPYGYMMTGKDIPPPKDGGNYWKAVRKSCAGFYLYRFDIWDFEKQFSLTSPAVAGKRVPVQLRKAFLKGEIQPGMTGDMVARINGFPREYRTRASHLKEVTDAPVIEWCYRTTPPFHYIVRFRRGKVETSYETGQLQ